MKFYSVIALGALALLPILVADQFQAAAAVEQLKFTPRCSPMNQRHGKCAMRIANRFGKRVLMRKEETASNNERYLVPLKSVIENPKFDSSISQWPVLRKLFKIRENRSQSFS